MPSSIEISKDAHDLWLKMLEQGGSLKPTQLTKLLGKTVGTPLKKELLISGLIKQVRNKPVEFEAVPIDPATKVEIKAAAAKKQRALKQEKLGLAKPPSKSSPSFTEIMEQVGKYCQPYFERIEELTSDISEIKKILKNMGKEVPQTTHSGQGSGAIINPKTVPLNHFYETLKRTCQQLDDKSRYGGEIPLPEIWDMMSQLNLGITWEIFQDYLVKLEDERQIDLHIANDPSQVHHPDKGFNVPGRGLVYYVAMRS